MINQLLESLRLEEFEDMLVVYDLEAHCQRLLDSIEALDFSLIPMGSLRSKDDGFILFIQNQIKNKTQYQFCKPVSFANTSLQTNSAAILTKRNGTRIHKLRLVYSKNSSFTIEIEPYTRDLAKAWQVKILSPKEFQIDSNDPKWRHKFYPRPTIPNSLFTDYDEIIWINEKGHVCEGSFTNIFFQDKAGKWHTPHLDCGILPGTMRAYLIQELKATDGFYSRNDLKDKVLLVNSMFIKEVDLIPLSKLKH